MYLMKDRTEASKLLKNFILWSKTDLAKVLKWLELTMDVNLLLGLCKNSIQNMEFFVKTVVWIPLNKMGELSVSIATS